MAFLLAGYGAEWIKYRSRSESEPDQEAEVPKA
jgi:hypothetical protein